MVLSVDRLGLLTARVNEGEAEVAHARDHMRLTAENGAVFDSLNRSFIVPSSTADFTGRDRRIILDHARYVVGAVRA